MCPEVGGSILDFEAHFSFDTEQYGDDSEVVLQLIEVVGGTAFAIRAQSRTTVVGEH